MKLLLIAIESTNENGIGSHISINPGNVKVEADTRVFLIVDSNDKIKRAHYYCEIYHKDVVDLSKIKKCKFLTSKFENQSYV